MSSQTKLETEGNLTDHPLAELLVETTEAHLSGSFRLASEGHKIVIYLNRGEVVFAASNARQHRLYETLLKEKTITGANLTGIKNFVNDLDLGQYLLERKVLTKPELIRLFTKQIEEIIKAGLSWETGTWNFNSLVRIKDSIQYETDLHQILLEHARKLKADEVIRRFGSDRETFGLKPNVPVHLILQSHEAFILSRFDNSFLTLGDIDALSGLPENITRQVLYTLWLGGFLFRQNWEAALSQAKISRFLSANVRIKRDDETVPEETAPATVPEPSETPPPNISAPESVPEEKEAAAPAEPEVSAEQLLGEYLERIENADTLYEVIGVSPEAETSEIKQKYFAQAKKYHPDLFYKQADLHGRVQNAFTELAHAYETLKVDKSRDLYNYKMRKELAQMESRRQTGASGDESQSRQIALAADNFESGLDHLTQGDFDEAIPFFARAVHFAPNNARYHAFYGKALSGNKKNQHQAEAELQTAVKIEPENTTYRLMLAELFVHIGLRRRAEGELTRLLAIAPNDREALALLDSLQRK